MKHYLFTIVALFFVQICCLGQSKLPANSRPSQVKKKLKPVGELINREESSWNLVMQWKKEANNKVEILPRDSKRAENALYQLQLSTRSSIGAIIYESGGIMIDDGWIRILGSGSARLSRSLPAWNKGKSFDSYGDQPSFLLVADDVLGGFFALNGGGITDKDIGKIFYFAPDNLTWESTGLDYSNFIIFCFTGDLGKFYDGLRWNSWQADVRHLQGDKGISCTPFLYTKEAQDINKIKRTIVPIQELWDIYFADIKKKTTK